MKPARFDTENLSSRCRAWQLGASLQPPPYRQRAAGHRSRGRADLPTAPTSAPERRAAAAGRCTPRRSRGVLKDGRRRPVHLVSAARLCSVMPPAKRDALLCDSAKLVLCLAELLVRDASQMYPCRKDASESQRRAIDMGSLPPLSSSHTPSASL